MVFTKESDFEEALIKILFEKGWENEVLKNATEEELIENWANILYENNRDIDRLDNFPLTKGEMDQIIEQITSLRTPLNLNGFINGKTVAITRDNPADKRHFGKEISLKIYDRREIAAGQSRYQIVQQPKFPTKSKILNDRRGDLLLLINGMPVIHVEMKKSGVPVSQAANQIALSLASFTFMFAMGMSVAAMIRVANQKGLNDYKKLRIVAMSIFLLAIILEIAFALIFVVFHKHLPVLFVDMNNVKDLVKNTEVVTIAAQLLLVAAVFQISDGIQVVVLGALRGLQDVKIPMYMTFISYWIIGFPVSIYLGLYTELKAAGIWIGLLAGLTSAAIFLYIRFNYLTKKLINQNA